MQRCPTCDCLFEPDGVHSLPFCTSRCRLVDLGRWYNERIGIPVRRSPHDDEEASELPEGWDLEAEE
ncbi:MAG TPA: DNA gyrase inhibitor YacG [Pirellulaceae bacterium]|nr:DNA gyrase inhibitor YacG [Pirellulaceae bacterium]